MPVKMDSGGAVVIGEKVYIGGVDTENVADDYQVLQYDPSRDEWSRLPPHHVAVFAMAQFKGNLITVGGGIRNGGFTGKVYRFIEQSQRWEEFLKPMPTGRFLLSVATTQSAIVASGGVAGSRVDHPLPCATVEVYSSETSQWHTAEPLLVHCIDMASVIIADTLYLLGGFGANSKRIYTVLYGHLTALIQKTTSPTHQSASHTSVWKNLPDTPLVESAAASLSGNLLAVGGYNDDNDDDNDDDDDDDKVPPAVHIFFPLTNSWVRVTTADLPEPRYNCTAVQLSSNRLLVVGGKDNQNKYTKTVFLGTITI